MKENQNPSCNDKKGADLFDCNCYLGRYADLLQAFGMDCAKASQHWISHGMRERRNAACDDDIPSYDCNCYLKRYSDLRKAFGSDCYKAWDHWTKHGIKEKRNPTCDRSDGQKALLEVSSFTNLVSYAEVGEHLYQSYHRINNPLTKARYLQTLCAELEEKKGIEALQKQCNSWTFRGLMPSSKIECK